MKRDDLARAIAAGGRLDGGSYRADGAETVFTARALEQIRTQTYDTKYPNLKIREIVPVDNSVNPGATVVTFGQYSMVGLASIIASYSQRLPRADVFRVESTARIVGIGTSYGFSTQEIRSAQFAGVPLEQRKANAARRVFEEKVEVLGEVGDTNTGVLGFLNQPNTSAYVVPNGAASSPLWANKTPDEILKDLNGICTGIINSTKEIESPDTLLLPTKQYQYIATTPRSSVSDTTILDVFRKGRPEVNVMSWFALAGAGASSTDRMVAYSKDPDHLLLVIPLEFTQLAPQWEGLEIVTQVEGRCGGVQVFYPLSISYGDGI